MRSTAIHNCIAQLSLVGLAWVAALALLPTSVCASHVLDAETLEVPETGISIYGPAYVLDNYTRREGSDLYFTDKHGNIWELVEDPAAPVISNKGDGAFHPFDPAAVAAACEAVSFPLEKLNVEIFILPYPRADLLDCSADDGAIYLSPGMYEVHEAHTHMIVTHELGHCVQREFMPERERNLWARYRELRGISDFAAYNAATQHSMRPQEIFAEDFRWLFGDALSKYSGTIENPELVLPDRVAGLKEYMLSLAEVRLGRSTAPSTVADLEITSYPNPFSKATTVSLKMGQTSNAMGYAIGSTSVRALVFDACGRSIKDLGRSNVGGNTHVQFRWDGTDDYGRHLASGVYFLRVELDQGSNSSFHKMLLKR